MTKKGDGYARRRARINGFNDGYANRPARSVLIEYQRAWKLGRAEAEKHAREGRS